MARAYIGVGSNIEPAQNLRRALRLLSGMERVTAVSTVYRTAALGRPEQADYCNCVVEIETRTPPLDLRDRVLRRIEQEMGRVRGVDRYAARTIDLDLLAYGDARLDGDPLTLPDPETADRSFVAGPLAELAPALFLPHLGITVAEAAALLPAQGVLALPEYTQSLREELGIGQGEGRAPGARTARRDR